jgi:hypothetical protein
VHGRFGEVYILAFLKVLECAFYPPLIIYYDTHRHQGVDSFRMRESVDVMDGLNYTVLSLLSTAI